MKKTIIELLILIPISFIITYFFVSLFTKPQYFSETTIIYRGVEYYICDNTNCNDCFRQYLKSEPKR